MKPTRVAFVSQDMKLELSVW